MFKIAPGNIGQRAVALVTSMDSHRQDASLSSKHDQVVSLPAPQRHLTFNGSNLCATPTCTATTLLVVDVGVNGTC